MKRIFRRSDVRPDGPRDVHEEIDFYLEMRTRELIERGMSADDARREAVRAFGDVAAIESEVRGLQRQQALARRRRDWWRGVAIDVAYAIRTLRANPGFTLATLATLTLGIGATVAVFTVVDGVLLRPLPYRDPAHIAMVWLVGDDAGGESNQMPLSSGFFVDVEQSARAFTRIAAFRSWSYTIGTVDAEQLTGARTSPALFDVLGVLPLIGRSFTAQDAVPGAPKVALISHALWRRRFGEDRSVVGRPVTLSGEAFTIIGIMPQGFAFPRGAELPAALQFGLRTDVWTPLVLQPRDRTEYGTLNLAAVARLAPGSSPAQAQRELSAQLKRFLTEKGATVRLDYNVISLREQAGIRVRRTLLVLLGAVTLVLLISCANVTSLLLARTGARHRELAVRAALGASRSRLALQLVTENLILAFTGAALALGLAVAGSRAMLALVPGSLPRADDVSVDWRVLALAAAVAMAAAAVFALGASLSVRWSNLASSLRDAGARTTAGAARQLGRRLLVTAEVSLSIMLLIAAALLTRTFVELQRVRPGFDPANVLTAGVLLPLPGDFAPARDGAHWTAVFQELEGRIRAAPEVSAVGAVSGLPLSGAVESARLVIPGRPASATGQGPMAQYLVIDGDYFGAMRIALRSGRAFDTRDGADATPVLIISQDFARRYFGAESPVGKLVVTPFDFAAGKHPRMVVGVVDDVKQTTLEAETTPQVYVPQTQMPYPGLTLVVRTPGEPGRVKEAIDRALHEVDPSLAAHDVRSLADVAGKSLARQRFGMMLVAIFAISSLALAVIGVYGVIALSVSQRKRELGVRLALGAQAADVVRLVVADGMVMTATGLIVGVIGALLLSRVMASLLYGVSATDPVLFAGAAVTVLAVALVACYLPARRASRVDPTIALRAE